MRLRSCVHSESPYAELCIPLHQMCVAVFISKCNLLRYLTLCIAFAETRQAPSGDAGKNAPRIVGHVPEAHLRAAYKESVRGRVV